jgi:hypothetical protein
MIMQVQVRLVRIAHSDHLRVGPTVSESKRGGKAWRLSGQSGSGSRYRGRPRVLASSSSNRDGNEHSSASVDRWSSPLTVGFGLTSVSRGRSGIGRGGLR